MAVPGQQSLENFFRSVQFDNPAFAAAIAEDVEIVGLYALGLDKSGGMEAANRLRSASFNLAEAHRRMLENTLRDLGY